MAALRSGDASVTIGTVRPGRAPCLRIVPQHQREDQDDQPEEGAQHDPCAQGRALRDPPAAAAGSRPNRLGVLGRPVRSAPPWSRLRVVDSARTAGSVPRIAPVRSTLVRASLGVRRRLRVEAATPAPPLARSLRRPSFAAAADADILEDVRGVGGAGGARRSRTERGPAERDLDPARAPEGELPGDVGRGQNRLALSPPSTVMTSPVWNRAASLMR